MKSLLSEILYSLVPKDISDMVSNYYGTIIIGRRTGCTFDLPNMKNGLVDKPVITESMHMLQQFNITPSDAHSLLNSDLEEKLNERKEMHFWDDFARSVYTYDCSEKKLIRIKHIDNSTLAKFHSMKILPSTNEVFFIGNIFIKSFNLNGESRIKSAYAVCENKFPFGIELSDKELYVICATNKIAVHDTTLPTHGIWVACSMELLSEIHKVDGSIVINDVPKIEFCKMSLSDSKLFVADCQNKIHVFDTKSHIHIDTWVAKVNQREIEITIDALPPDVSSTILEMTAHNGFVYVVTKFSIVHVFTESGTLIHKWTEISDIRPEYIVFNEDEAYVAYASCISNSSPNNQSQFVNSMMVLN